MERVAFIAALGALVPSVVLLQLSDRHLVRSLPLKCNFVLDAKPYTSPDDIYEHLTCMGPTGRALYIDFYLFDWVLFPLIYGTALIGLLKRLWPSMPWLQVLPVIGAIVDVIENTCMRFLLWQFPMRYRPAEIAVSFLTPTKWGVVALAIAFALIGGIWMLVARPKHGKTS